MKHNNKSMDELINDLIELEEKYASLEGFMQKVKDERANEYDVFSKLISASKNFLDVNFEKINYAEILQVAIDISGAKYAALNLFEDDQLSFRTVEFAGVKNDEINKGLSILGFDVRNKNWTHDAARYENINKNTITTYKHLHELTVKAIPKNVIKALEKVFNLGEAYVVRINKGSKLLGDFTLMFEKGKSLNNPKYLELYSYLTGHLLDRSNLNTSIDKINQRFDVLFMDLPISILVHDIETGKILDANKKAMESYGFSTLEELKEYDIWLPPPYSFIEAKEWIRKAAAEGSQSFEWQSKKSNGDLFWEQISLVSVILNDIERMLVIATDITQIKKLESSLKLSEKTYRDTFDNSISGLCIHEMLYDEKGVPHDCKYVDVNDAFETHTGLSPDFLIGKTIREVYPNKEADGVIEMYKGVFKTHAPIQNEIYFKPTNCWYQIGAFPMEDNKFTVVVHNISHRKKTEQELIIAKEKAEESDRLKSAFLANMSHEIRTPMNGILGFAEILQEEDLPKKLQGEYLEIIQKSGKRLLNLINDIVDISKIETGLMNVNSDVTNIMELIENVYLFFNPEMESKEITFVLRNKLQESDVHLITDKEKVFAVMSNLVKNAIKYSNAGIIEIGCEKLDDYFQFFVKDSGIGIPKDAHPFLFDRFYQVDPSHTRSYQGVGLGLPISKAYIEALGGKIWVDSEEGKGAVFYFTLPCATDTIELPQTETEQDDPNQKVLASNLKVLIVEDDMISELIITKNIQSISNNILFAKNGFEALAACKNNPDIDLVLMDIQMAGMDGYEATRKIRTFNKDVIIIAQTAYGFSDDKNKAMEAGCNDYISKPISKDRLFALINKYFGSVPH